MNDIKDRIDKVLNDSSIKEDQRAEILVISNPAPNTYIFICKRNRYETVHCSQYPYLIRGFDEKRGTLYEYFTACDTQNTAMNRLKAILMQTQFNR